MAETIFLSCDTPNPGSIWIRRRRIRVFKHPQQRWRRWMPRVSVIQDAYNATHVRVGRILSCFAADSSTYLAIISPDPDQARRSDRHRLFGIRDQDCRRPRVGAPFTFSERETTAVSSGASGCCRETRNWFIASWSEGGVNRLADSNLVANFLQAVVANHENFLPEQGRILHHSGHAVKFVFVLPYNYYVCIDSQMFRHPTAAANFLLCISM